MSGWKFEWACALRDRNESDLDPRDEDKDRRPLTVSELAVLWAFCAFTNTDGVSFVGPETLAGPSGYHGANADRSVKRPFASVQRKGWLVKLPREPGDRRTYRRLAVPADSGSRATPDSGSSATLTSGSRATRPVAVQPPEVVREVDRPPSRRARAGSEPPEFATLVHGVGLAHGGRAEVCGFWEAEPERVAACVAEWWRRRERSLVASPGLLVRMVRDGDDPSPNGRRPRREAAPPCPYCEVGGGQHTADCPSAARMKESVA